VFTDVPVRPGDSAFTDLCDPDSLGHRIVWWDLACALAGSCLADGAVSSSRDWCIERRTQALTRDLDLDLRDERAGWERAAYNGTNWIELIQSAAEFDLVNARTAFSVHQRYEIAGRPKQFEAWVDKHKILLLTDLAEEEEAFHEAHTWAGPEVRVR
jgi:hypothetical protein